MIAFSETGEGLVVDDRNPFWALLRGDIAARAAAAGLSCGKEVVTKGGGTATRGAKSAEPTAAQRKWAALLADEESKPQKRRAPAAPSDLRVDSFVESRWKANCKCNGAPCRVLTMRFPPIPFSAPQAMSKTSFKSFCVEFYANHVGKTISYVVQGVMRREDALERLRFQHSNEALSRFYKSATAQNLSDEEDGLYGQSALFIFGQFLEETECNRNPSGNCLDETKRSTSAPGP